MNEASRDSRRGRPVARGTLRADVCVVGAGPAGLVLGAELVAHGLDVLVLESGAEPPSPTVQALNDGTVLGDAYAGLSTTRHRGVGGTAGIWNTVAGGQIGAKYVPLDAPDLEARGATTMPGWPFGPDELAPWYERALPLCGLREPSFEAATWTSSRRRPLAGLGSSAVSRVYQLASRRALVGEALTRLRRGARPGVARTDRLRTGATVVRLETEARGARVTAAQVASSDGGSFRVEAERFVLAGGAIENARLLLASAGRPDELGNAGGWVGRCFMEHPRDTALRLVPGSTAFYREAAFYDLHRADDGTWILGRLALSEDTLRREDLPNASGTLLPRVRPSVRRARRLLGPLRGLSAVGRLLPAGGHGWSRHPAPGLVFDGFTLLLNLEQLPHPENRITLSEVRDALGVPRSELRWRWRREDQERLERLREVMTEALEATGLVRVSIDPTAGVDPNAHHHAGTTRIGRTAADGVVDANLRVHGVENLYVAGASTFPTAGFANPLLTIVALSTRLASHLAR